PFGALDAQTKLQMQEWLLQIWSDFGKTVIFVTHDVEEAVFLSDEVHVMGTRPGRVVETLTVDLPRPRLRSCTSTPQFVARKGGCRELLRVFRAAPAERGGWGRRSWRSSTRPPHPDSPNGRRRRRKKAFTMAAAWQSARCVACRCSA